MTISWHDQYSYLLLSVNRRIPPTLDFYPPTHWTVRPTGTSVQDSIRLQTKIPTSDGDTLSVIFVHPLQFKRASAIRYTSLSISNDIEIHIKTLHSQLEYLIGTSNFWPDGSNSACCVSGTCAIASSQLAAVSAGVQVAQWPHTGSLPVAFKPSFVKISRPSDVVFTWRAVVFLALS